MGTAFAQRWTFKRFLNRHTPIILKIEKINKIVFNIVVGLLTLLGCNSRPDHFPYAERYKLMISQSDMLSAIERFKKENPEYCIPAEMHDLSDGHGEGPVYPWYRIYFYYPAENEVLFTWIRQTPHIADTITIFAFVSVENVTTRSWKKINKDLSDSENIEQKKKFEERILKKIEEKLGVSHITK